MLSIFFIGLALSMDAFSLALSIGLNDLSRIKRTIIPLTVGSMHFIMPLFGNLIGEEILNIININPKIIMSIILLYLAVVMFLDRKKEKKVMISSLLSILLFSFSVSIDSFSVGIGLAGLTDKYLLSYIIFSLCSMCITHIGLIVGKYSSKYLKERAVYVGIFILLILSIVNLCQVFKI